MALTIAVMYALAFGVERLVLRPLVNQPDIILLMATFGLTYFLIGFGELVFGGNPKEMITSELGLPSGAIDLKILGGTVTLQKLDIAAAAIASDHGRRPGAALPEDPDRPRACAPSPTTIRPRSRSAFRSTRSGSSSGSPPASSRWRPASCGAPAPTFRSRLQIVALKALPVLILGGLTSVPGAIVGGLIIGIGEKLGEFYWGPLAGGGIERWLAYAIALAFLLFRPQGLFGERIIERI